MNERRPRISAEKIRRAVEALEAAGKQVVRVEIEGGKLVIVTSPEPEPAGERNEWDGVGASA